MRGAGLALDAGTVGDYFLRKMTSSRCGCMNKEALSDPAGKEPEPIYDIKIDSTRRRVTTTWGSIVTDAALMDYQKTVWSDPARHGFDELIDFRTLEQIEVTTEGLEAVAYLAAGMDASVGPGRFAIVVGDTLSYGLSRMYEAFRGIDEKTSRQLMIFKRLEDALEWLDKPRAA